MWGGSFRSCSAHTRDPDIVRWERVEIADSNGQHTYRCTILVIACRASHTQGSTAMFSIWVNNNWKIIFHFPTAHTQPVIIIDMIRLLNYASGVTSSIIFVFENDKTFVMTNRSVLRRMRMCAFQLTPHQHRDDWKIVERKHGRVSSEQQQHNTKKRPEWIRRVRFYIISCLYEANSSREGFECGAAGEHNAMTRKRERGKRMGNNHRSTQHSYQREELFSFGSGKKRS